MGQSQRDVEPDAQDSESLLFASHARHDSAFPGKDCEESDTDEEGATINHQKVHQSMLEDDHLQTLRCPPNLQPSGGLVSFCARTFECAGVMPLTVSSEECEVSFSLFVCLVLAVECLQEVAQVHGSKLALPACAEHRSSVGVVGVKYTASKGSRARWCVQLRDPRTGRRPMKRQEAAESYARTLLADRPKKLPKAIKKKDLKCKRLTDLAGTGVTPQA